MELSDAIKLINRDTIKNEAPQVWADLGCGSGLFSYALANILPAQSTVYAIDRQNTRLTKQQNPHNILIKQKQLDFISDELQLENLDGILMANSLHFAKDKISLVAKMAKSLKTGTGFLIVEYDTDNPNPWVPFPVSYRSLKKLFEEVGFGSIGKIHEMPSAFGRSLIYGAVIG